MWSSVRPDTLADGVPAVGFSRSTQCGLVLIGEADSLGGGAFFPQHEPCIVPKPLFILVGRANIALAVVASGDHGGGAVAGVGGGHFVAPWFAASQNAWHVSNVVHNETRVKHFRTTKPNTSFHEDAGHNPGLRM